MKVVKLAVGFRNGGNLLRLAPLSSNGGRTDLRLIETVLAP